MLSNLNYTSSAPPKTQSRAKDRRINSRKSACKGYDLWINTTTQFWELVCVCSAFGVFVKSVRKWLKNIFDQFLRRLLSQVIHTTNSQIGSRSYRTRVQRTGRDSTGQHTFVIRKCWHQTRTESRSDWKCLFDNWWDQCCTSYIWHHNTITSWVTLTESRSWLEKAPHWGDRDEAAQTKGRVSFVLHNEQLVGLPDCWIQTEAPFVQTRFAPETCLCWALISFQISSVHKFIVLLNVGLVV